MTLSITAHGTEAEEIAIDPALPHATRPVLIVCGALALLWLTVSGGVVSTWEHVRHYCEIPVYVGTGAGRIESAFLERLPVGSTRLQVQSYLERRGLGTDGYSACSTINGRSLTCYIPSHHHFWELIRETYTIAFDFDPDRKLQMVRVRSRLTYL